MTTGNTGTGEAQPEQAVRQGAAGTWGGPPPQTGPTPETAPQRAVVVRRHGEVLHIIALRPAVLVLAALGLGNLLAPTWIVDFNRASRPLGVLCLLGMIVVLATIDLMQSVVAIDPRNGTITTWHSRYLMSWMRKTEPLADYEVIHLDQAVGSIRQSPTHRTTVYSPRIVLLGPNKEKVVDSTGLLGRAAENLYWVKQATGFPVRGTWHAKTDPTVADVKLGGWVKAFLPALPMLLFGTVLLLIPALSWRTLYDPFDKAALLSPFLLPPASMLVAWGMLARGAQLWWRGSKFVKIFRGLGITYAVLVCLAVLAVPHTRDQVLFASYELDDPQAAAAKSASKSAPSAPPRFELPLHADEKALAAVLDSRGAKYEKIEVGKFGDYRTFEFDAVEGDLNAHVVVYDFGIYEPFTKDNHSTHVEQAGRVLTMRWKMAEISWEEAKKQRDEIAGQSFDDTKSMTKALRGLGYKLDQAKNDDTIRWGARTYLLFAQKGTVTLTFRMLEYGKTAAGKEPESVVSVLGDRIVFVSHIKNAASRERAQALADALVRLDPRRK